MFGCTLLLIAALATQAPAARACSLDGIASISMNGNTASLTPGAPSASDAAHWAPFTLLAAAPGDALHLSEDLSKVRNSLSAAMMRTPFRWIFDDGGAARGYAVTHRFSRLGWHKIIVEYYYPTRHQWLTFDNAQLQIVPASALLKTNFSYYAGKVLLFAMRAAIWIVAGIIILAAIAARVQRRRGHEQSMPMDDPLAQ
jgi:hypothetical protein